MSWDAAGARDEPGLRVRSPETAQSLGQDCCYMQQVSLEGIMLRCTGDSMLLLQLLREEGRPRRQRPAKSDSYVLQRIDSHSRTHISSTPTSRSSRKEVHPRNADSSSLRPLTAARRTSSASSGFTRDKDAGTGLSKLRRFSMEIINNF